MNTASLAFFKGLLIGTSISLPVGPIAILCIRRTLHYGPLSGIFSGLGAATADAFYGALACFGVNFLSSFLIQQRKILTWFGAIFLGFLGMKIFFTAPTRNVRFVGAGNALSMYLSTLFLTLSNPMTVLAFTALMAGFGVADLAGHDGIAVAVVSGVFLGSALWWSLLVIFASLLRSKIDWPVLTVINKTSGIVIILFAFVILLSLKYPFLLAPSCLGLR